MSDVNLYGVCLPRPVLDIMFSTLKSMNLSKLSLCSVRLGSDGLLKLSSYLKDNTCLKNLMIGSDTIDLPVASSLSDAVKDHPCLEGIGFIKCGLDNAAALRIILEGCHKLKELLIIKDNIGSEGVHLLADFISSNNNVYILQLDENKMSDSDTLLLAAALKKNTNLRQLYLENDEITKAGEKSLLKAVFDPTSMDSIVESNHMCRVYTFDTSKPLIVKQRYKKEREVMNINRKNKSMSIQQKIRKKVVLALCGCRSKVKLFDLSHFNDLPLQLMPRVLELIQEHSKSRTNICRKKPEQLIKMP